MTCVLLLHGDNTVDGTTTIVDSSDSAHVVASVGAVQTDTAQSKFGGSSILFNGATDYLLLDGGSDFAFDTGDFTIDMWVRLAATGVAYSLYDGRNSGTVIPAIEVTTGNVIKYYTNSTDKIVGTTTLSAATWYHVALTRFAGATRLFLNGVQEGTTFVDTNSYVNDASRPVIGARGTDLTAGRLNGWLDGVRVIKGQAMWVANFTPPTSAYVGDESQPEEVLMLHFEGADASTTFTDSSPRALAITANGNAQLDTAQFAFGSSSGLFDGTGDYLNCVIPPFFGSDFTIEGRFRFASVAASQGIFQWDAAPSINAELNVSLGTKIRIRESYNNSFDLIGTTTIAANTWYHIAFVRNNDAFYLFVNGVLEASAIAAITYSAGAFYVGASVSGSSSINGWIDEFRVVAGRCDYTASFTPRTAPFHQSSNAVLLLHADAPDMGRNVIDTSDGVHRVYANFGDAQIDDAQSKFGGTAIKFDGTGDFVGLDGSSDFAFGSGDFTIDLWYRPAAINIDCSLYDARPSGVNGDYITVYASSADNKVRLIVSGTSVITGSTALATGNWYHIALTRSGTSTRLFINGTQEGSTWTDSTVYINAPARPVIGIGNDLSSSAANGWVDELRIVKGIAWWTANFTSPSAPWTGYETLGPSTQGALTISNATTLAFAGSAIAAAQFTTTGATTAAFVGAAIGAATFTITGSTTAAFAATRILSGQFTTTGASALAFSFAATAAFQFTATGSSTPAFAGTGILSTAFTITPATTPVFAGASTAAGQLTVAGSTTPAFASTTSNIQAGTVTITGSTTAAFAATALLPAQWTVTAATTIALTGASIAAAQLTVAGSTTAAFAATGILSTQWTIAASSTPAFVGASIAAGQLSVAGATTVAFTGTAVRSTAFTISNVTTAAFVGAANVAAQLTIAGSTTAAFAVTALIPAQWTVSLASTVSWKGAGIAAAQFTTTGATALSWIGAALQSGTGALTYVGQSLPAFTGASIAAAQLTVSGSTAAAFTGASIAGAQFTAAGSSTVAFAGAKLINGTFTIAGSSAAAFVGSIATVSNLTITGASSPAFAATGIFSSQWTVSSGATLAFAGTAMRSGAVTVAGSTTAAFTGQLLRAGALTVTGQTVAGFTIRATSAGAFTMAGNSTFVPHATSILGAILTAIGSSNIVFASVAPRQPTIARSRSSQAHPRRTPVTMPKRPPVYG